MAEGINSVSGTASQVSIPSEATTENLDKIDTIFTTTLIEKDRTTFDETFEGISLDDEKAFQGSQFLDGLKKNKAELMQRLKLTSEQYDALSCITLALASQETGMGLEKGYVGENTWYKDLRLNAIYLKGEGSASSGLTQMKINDFVNSEAEEQGDVDEDNSEENTIYNDFGVITSGYSVNNLFEEEDVAACATIIALSNIISEGYGKYHEVLDKNHEQIRERLDSELSDEECIEKGLNLIDSVKDFYDTMTPEEQEELRVTFKQWLLSNNGSEDNALYYLNNLDDLKGLYNEEKQLGILNKMLQGSGFELKQDDLDYIRYALTSENQEMNITEFAAYGWHTGIGDKGMQLDRLLAEKLGTIFVDPEKFDYDQFSLNVESLAERYAQQFNADINMINRALEQYYG